MELITLRYFVTVAEELHFRRAAEKLNMTQGPLSTAIKKLEDELEISLFERSSRMVKLTEAGEFFLHEAKAVLQRAELAEKNLQMRFSNSHVRWAIGYNEPALNTVLPSLLSFCNQNLPDIELELRELESSEQIKALQEGTLDMGFMRPYGFELGDLKSQTVHREKYMLVMPSNHPLASAKIITAKMLAKQDIVLFARDVNPALFDLLTEKMTYSQAEPPNFKQSARTKSSMLAMVRAGFGAALLPESSIKKEMSDLALAEPAFELPSIDITAVWNPANSSPVLQKIMALFKEYHA